MSRPIRTPDVLNNSTIVKESTVGLFHQEPVYLPFSSFPPLKMWRVISYVTLQALTLR